MKNNRKQNPKNNMNANQSAPVQNVEEYSFGDPMEVLDRRELLDYIECHQMGKWFEPPMSWDGLTRAFGAAIHHSSPIYVKRNVLVSTFIPHPLLSRATFTSWALDYLVYGNAYLECQRNFFGQPLPLRHAPAKYVRRGIDCNSYWWVRGWNDESEFTAESIHHLIEPDLSQEIYGLPSYLAALNSAFLNESSTLFRRRYYKNGSHAGVIFYMTDAAQDQTYVDDMRNAIKSSKGPGNFRNLFVYAPNGKKDGIQVIPVSEIAAKDDFLNIKNVTRDDLLSAHRVPPQLMGIMPNNTGGFGDARDAAAVFSCNEIEPIQQRMKELNDWLGIEVIRFDPYKLAAKEKVS